MQTISDQDLRYARCMLFDLRQPSAETREAPLIGDVVDQQNALRTTRVGPDDRSEATLPGGIPWRKEKDEGESTVAGKASSLLIALVGAHGLFDQTTQQGHSTSKQTAFTRVEV